MLNRDVKLMWKLINSLKIKSAVPSLKEKGQEG